MLLLAILLAPLLLRAQLNPGVKVGAERQEAYLPMLAGKKVGLLINQTSRAGDKLLVDVLLQKGVQVKKIFVPEHGFRGTADAGAHVANSRDSTTGLPVISLYGNNKKPTAEQLKDIDILVYDLQDVGVRFYTYISTLQYAMEACAENGKMLIVLDRPNPNDFVDGPVLEPKYKSFVGMQEVPIAYGMTVGEYAKMLVGEKLFPGAENANFSVISCEGWKHGQAYELPVAPSPNLRSAAAILLYPAMCLFEGTVVSVGRGTDKPFQQWGYPSFSKYHEHHFTPKSGFGAAKPMYEGQECGGDFVADDAPRARAFMKQRVDLSMLCRAYNDSGEKFFTPFFEKLTGTAVLRTQIIAKKPESVIRASWQPGLNKFKAIRKKYLLYD